MLTSTYILLPTANLGKENPLPIFRDRKPKTFNIDDGVPEKYRGSAGVHQKVLPYTVQDGYDRCLTPKKIKALLLENEYLSAIFLPEWGGRLHSLYDKRLGRELLFTNTVIQPCNLAIRNAWLSGGIEWNIGCIGHTFTTCDNVFAAALKDESGEDFIRIYEFERLKSIFWQADFHLPRGSRHLITHVKMVNPFPKDTTTYWWTNIAAPDEGKTRVFNSGEEVICVVGSDMSYGKLPDGLDCMKGDLSYPSKASRSFDYFVQPNTPDECTWEAASYNDGTLFYERSTPPLSCKKLFTWGTHPAGKHWQEYLSEEGRGYYAELQAGISPSQLHDMILPANTTLEWTQVFGGARCDDRLAYDDDYGVAKAHVSGIINERISENELLALNERLKGLAAKPITADNIIHTGSGFGAVEAMRMEKDGDGEVPTSMCFPEYSITKREHPWRYLIKYGIFPKEDPRYYTVSYMTSDKWLPHIREALDEEYGGRTWYSLMQYGVAIYDGADHTRIATEAYDAEEDGERAIKAKVAWLESLKLEPTALVYRNLGRLEWQYNRLREAAEYYALAAKLPAINDDPAIYAEYLLLLIELGENEKAWEIYESIPDGLRENDRIKAYAALIAVRLERFDFVEKFLDGDFVTIREGEEIPTDVWFEMQARKIARERGITPTPEAINKLCDEIWNEMKPPVRIDFRQSYDRTKKYR